MKKRIICLLVVLFIGITTGCRECTQSTDDFITVDVSIKHPKKELILQDFMDVEYIPLETTDEFMTTGFVQAVGRNILLVRNVNQAGRGNIFIFDRTGKGLRKINRLGQSGEEYTGITGLIALDEENGEMYVNDSYLRKVFVYDLYGNFKRSFMHMEGGADWGEFKTDVRYDPIYSFDRNHLICQDYLSGRDFSGSGFRDLEPRNIFWIISKQDGSVVKEIQIPFEKKVFQVLLPNTRGEPIGMVSNLGIIPYRDNWILTEPSADTIYHYSTDHKMRPFIVRTPSVHSMTPEVFLYPGVITDRYYFMQAIKKELDEDEPRSKLLETELVYDKQEKKTFECIVYNGDFTTKRSTKSLVDEILTTTVVNDNEIAFMEKIDTYELLDAYEKGQLKGKLKEIAAGLHEESNPVIMLAKYKKGH